MAIRMYVVTHREHKLVNKTGYYPILVGACYHPEIVTYDIRDNTGDSISAKNPNYCELTGQYWIWKNDDSEVVGISHYRRYFTTKWFSAQSKYYLGIEDIDRILKKKRMILPKRRSTAKSILRSVNIAPNMRDVREIYQAIKSCSPEYLEDFLWYLDQNKAHLYNMFVMKRADFSQYCEWLFQILNYIEKHHDMEAETNPYRKRLFGFLSERLISIWVHHNVDDGDIREISVINTDESNLTRIRRLFGNISREIQYILMRNTKTAIQSQQEILQGITDEALPLKSR